jgi:hypothetical protein
MTGRSRNRGCLVLAPPSAGLVCLLVIVAGGGFGRFLATAGIKISQRITGDETLQHLQETNTVCGPIASARYAQGSPGNPTYLNFDRPYPHQSFAVVIPESARPKFTHAPEAAFAGKNICVTGLITMSRYGKPQMAVEDPSQIVLDNAPPLTTNQTDATSATK